MRVFHSKNEAKEFLLGKIENTSVVEDYRDYIASVRFIRELSDSEYHFWVAYDEVINGVKRT
jgi:hypothetical protein